MINKATFELSPIGDKQIGGLAGSGLGKSIAGWFSYNFKTQL
ncbi:hypothetical protein [Mucilaginibacter sp.]|jgi:hypothetical protein